MVEKEAACPVSRAGIYYWKCDRPAAFHGTQASSRADSSSVEALRKELQTYFGASAVSVSAGTGQGNHLTWNADVDGTPMFVRVENGPENDGHLAVESKVLDRVRESGVSTPLVHGCDIRRSRVPFAWQALERIAEPDLNHWYKQGSLDVMRIGFEIGEAVAKWQSINLIGFGALDISLSGFEASYSSYFRLHLERHLTFLVAGGFLKQDYSDEIVAVLAEHESLLDVAQGCLVHKDLALWNILGPQDRITAFIDFDDAISGDPMDDLSLLGCFHDSVFLRRAFEGYQSRRALPAEYRRRFWLHLLRNMIVKAVIRVGAGYFERDSQFFLIGQKGSGAQLKTFTFERIVAAMRGLREDLDIESVL